MRAAGLILIHPLNIQAAWSEDSLLYPSTYACRLVSALRFALNALREEAIDVRLVHYKGTKGDFSKLQDEFAPKKNKKKKK